jgi:ribosome biogenesis GTPase
MSTYASNSGDLGVVIKKNNGIYWVQSNGQTLTCGLSQRLRNAPAEAGRPGSKKETRLAPHGNPLAVGDTVQFIASGRSLGQITAILPRRNRLARRSPVPMPGAHAFELVIAANLDLVVPVFAAADPAPKWNLLDRYLASAESLELPALVCITKLDLTQDRDGRLDEELTQAVTEYRRIGYPVILTSTQEGLGLDELRAALAGKVSVMVGKSGVGKTSLLNALQPGLGLRVGQVNETTGNGRHTTISAELFPLALGGSIVDTPGVREFGLWDVDRDDLALFFPEMRPYVGRCRFGLDCQHEDEPGCALRKAVMSGQVSPRRYQSFLKLKEEGGAYD